MAGMTAVAVDRDKNSQQAVKWAVENLLIGQNELALIHVITNRHNGNGGLFMTAEATQNASRDLLEQEMADLFLPFKGFCARKGVLITEVVLEAPDIARALMDYIVVNCIGNFVLGASCRNIITKKLRNPDVPTSLIKAAPDFCTVYVVAKGKVVTLRSARSSLPAGAAPVSWQASQPRHPHDSDSAPKSMSQSRMPLPLDKVLPAQRSFERSVPDPRFYGSNPEMARSYQREQLPIPLTRTAPSASMLSDFMKTPYRTSPASHGSSAEEMDFHGSMTFQSNSSSSIRDTDSPGNSAAALSVHEDLGMQRLRLGMQQQEAEGVYNVRSQINAPRHEAEGSMPQWPKSWTAQNNTSKAEAEDTRQQKVVQPSNLIPVDGNMPCRRYSIEEIEHATERFSDRLKVGEGGYGPVFCGMLDHTPVAIKVLRPDADQGREQFQQEVDVLSRIRHPHMVLLLGACPEYGCLVYEYMDNGSLEDRLFRHGGTPPMPWTTRFRIAAEIAAGLLFLHQAKPEPLVHRDLKPANILLDRNYTSKISDVGLARLVPQSLADGVTQYHMTSAAGTFCYIDPEYQQTGMLGRKSDVYSLGVMLLQIITARPPMGLTHNIERSIEQGTFNLMLDPLVPDWPVEEALAYAKLAIKCTEMRKKDRPDLATVILPELNRLRNLAQTVEARTMRFG